MDDELVAELLTRRDEDQRVRHLFGLAVVMASLYPGVTVLLARVVLGERLRWVQRAGLGLAAIGILLIAA